MGSVPIWARMVYSAMDVVGAFQCWRHGHRWHMAGETRLFCWRCDAVPHDGED